MMTFLNLMASLIRLLYCTGRVKSGQIGSDWIFCCSDRSSDLDIVISFFYLGLFHSKQLRKTGDNLVSIAYQVVYNKKGKKSLNGS